MSIVTKLDTQETCQKCKNFDAFVVDRKEKLCQECFKRFIQGKLRRVMLSNKYKVNHKDQGLEKVMLAYSGSESSVCTLEMLLGLLDSQYENNNGKQGFELMVVNIHDDEENDDPVDDSVHHILAGHTTRVHYKTMDLTSFMTGKVLKRINVDNKFNIMVDDNEDENKTYGLQEVFDLIPNKTSMEDFKQVIYEEILLNLARANGCGTLLYCNHIGNLSSEILSLIIKGRGANVDDKINDKVIDFHGTPIQILNPVRELFIHEITLYNQISDLSQYTTPSKPVSNINKNMTVRQITDRYFNQVESAGYTSTIPTVLKIGEKLTAPSKFHHQTTCKICNNTIYQDPQLWLTRITVNDPEPLTTPEELEYAALYQRHIDTMKLVNSNFVPSDTSICYGCIISMNGVKPDTGLLWPMSDKEVLEEYIIDSDESDEE